MRTITRCCLLAAAALLVLFAAPRLEGFGHMHGFDGTLVPAPEDYASEWKKVDKAIQEGKPRTALEIVDAIFTRAKAERNQQQLVRAVIYRAALRGDLTEQGDSLLVSDLHQGIAGAQEPARSVLQSVLAGVFWSYYQEHRWEIAGRTSIDAPAENDFRTWDARRFFDTTRALYLASIARAAELQRLRVASYRELIVPGTDDDRYRPTLYDILAHRALDFLGNDETDLPKPEREFELASLDALLPAAAFVSRRFETPDPADHAYLALTVYQDLLRFHLADPAPDARIDLDLQRLAWARARTHHPDKDTAYVEALVRLLTDAGRSSIASQVQYELALAFHGRGDERQAMDWIGRALAAFPSSRGAVNCASLRAEITAKSCSFSAEETQPPDTPFMIAARSRNVGMLFFRIVPLDPDDYERMISGGKRDDILSDLLLERPVRRWNTAMPAEGDYKEHAIDIAGPALPIGSYLLLASPREDFDMKRNAVFYAPLTVTMLSLQHQERPDGSVLFTVRDARTGEPRTGVTASLYTRRWNSARYEYEKVFVRSVKTDADGLFRLTPEVSRDYVSITLTDGRDVCPVRDQFSAYARGRSTPGVRTLFFTDRGLYRPGQTVYFKGIVVSEDAEKVRYATVAGRRTTVVFLDANQQKIAEQTLTTNDFGSFSGTFTAPSGVLTGYMTIRNENGSTSFRVEEYVRPKFDVAFDPPKEAAALGGTVTLRGSAASYAGAAIDGAAVRWRVTRQARFPFWWWWWRPMPSSPQKEIARGTATTDASGAFTLSFTAEPDRDVPKSTQPVFTYGVTADVTDINGETRSGSASVTLGYTSLALTVDAADACDASDSLRITLRSANLAGVPQSAAGTFAVEKLRAPSRLLRPRILPEPDRYPMSAQEFHEAFPEEAYKDEADEDGWPVDKVVGSGQFLTDTAGTRALTYGALAPGRYRITAVLRDRNGETVTAKRFITVYDRTSRTLPYPKTDLYVPIAVSVQPGDTAAFLWGTSVKGARVFYQIEKRGDITHQEWLTLDGAQRVFRIPVTEADRGGFTVRVSMVHGYRLYTQAVQVAVPWTNKQLSIETATFRDKLRPGQKEEWRLIVRGEKADSAAAEVLAAMYDASLDAIAPHGWPGFAWPVFWSWARMNERTFGAQGAQEFENEWNAWSAPYPFSYGRLNLFLLEGRGGWGLGRREMYLSKAGRALEAVNMVAPSAQAADRATAADGEAREKKSEAAPAPPPPAATPVDQVAARTNFNETAFFFPHCTTNDSGAVVLHFTMPEALTRWRFMAFAHTPDLKTGAIERSVVTQKELMVVPNPPRFLREGDVIVFQAKINNLTADALGGTVKLMLFDAVTMQPADSAFGVSGAAQAFTAAKGGSANARWTLRVPEGMPAVVYRIVASAGAFSDGEEAVLPVLPDRMVVTESMPLNIRGTQSRAFTFSSLLASGASPSLRQVSLTLEMTSNPAWYAVQALPYLIEYPYECSEQVFNRFYANSIAAHIANGNPNIRRVFDRWKGTGALQSNLDKNQDLKAVLLQETPWVLSAQDETERRKRIGLLFDLNTMADNLSSALRKLEQNQSSNGGWPWFPGMPESRHITQYIVSGFGRLRALGIVPDPRTARMIGRAIAFCDDRMNADYLRLKSSPGFNPKNEYLNQIEVQYLYARTAFPDTPIDRKYGEAVDFWRDQARRYWLHQPLLCQGMIALAAHRFSEPRTASAVLASLRERALQSDELGMYWKQNAGWYWYQAPIETQSVLIDAFDEIAHDARAVDEMKIWLLKQKQVQDWGSTVATADACYALLRRGADLLASNRLVDVTMGTRRIDPRAEGSDPEAGTGYYRVSWQRGGFTPSMGSVTVTKRDSGIAWGAVYWQYSERLERITPHATPLQIVKKLYRQVATASGTRLEPITGDAPLHVGDLLKVRIEITSDRDMEYVHLKDMRGAGFDLVNQLSGCRWQGRLSYYEAPKDASVNFFLSWLPKGVHVFEYPLRVSHAGTFSNGISTIQCMYAPEFAAHTEGLTVTVAEAG